MSTVTVSKRYAEALFQLAQEKSIVEQLEAELQIVKEVFENNEAFNKFLEHPRVSTDKKKQLIDKAFDGFVKEIINTLKILVDRHNEDAIPQIVDHFATLVNESKGIAEATVYSVRELSDNEKKELVEVFKQKLNLNNLNVTNVVEPSILGGVRVKIGNTIYDGTLKGRLARIERNIVSANK
ncbi:F0F1 ATP synthase subunit delta [Aquibacillus salsiterrae]|uniref:ATP synthase subunit delta n=1 Tax=Aquibacillus salsiterrae TaxID=2950439 RepID=A0A9X3WDI7_9BACI|nr:F0F1 ATP synthase subunit delta [Aquibacillus salsiterrae]MDC3416733.1 F0F1 ATP synthase subunit delta [Aquibacillus salsiterrae]